MLGSFGLARSTIHRCLSLPACLSPLKQEPKQSDIQASPMGVRLATLPQDRGRGRRLEEGGV
jgi:hypothetical protein